MAHDEIKDQYDEVQAQGLYEEGMARMALYHRHCQDPVIFRALGDVGGKPLLDLACGDGFYTRKFRRAGADPGGALDTQPAHESEPDRGGDQGDRDRDHQGREHHITGGI